jgi:acyl-CoA synthetase (AMP-forming)/AMP-acid ligase II
MFDLGNSFLSSVERDPLALAIVDGPVRLTYEQWYRRISVIVSAFDELCLTPGDHLVTVLQNRWEAASIHWARQFAGIVCTPINWRSKAHEIDYCVENSEAKAIVFEESSAAGVRESREAKSRPRIALDSSQGDEIPFKTMIDVRRRMSHRAPASIPGPSCSIRRARPPIRKAYRDGTAPSVPRPSPMSRKTNTPMANAHSASCRSTTQWVCARCWRCH